MTRLLIVRYFLIFCACLALGSWLVYQMQQGSGYVLVVLGKTSIEMNLWFGLLVLLGCLILLYLVLAIVRGGARGLVSAKNKFTNYGANRAHEQTTAGLIHFIEGDWSSAYRKLTRSAAKVSSPIINYLTAARCAYETGDEQNALELLHKAEKSASNSNLAVALTQARMQLANQQYEQALATLRRASEVSPNHHVVLSLQQQVYIELKDWSSLKSLLPKLHKHNIGSVKERYYLEQTLYRSLLTQQIQRCSKQTEDEKYLSLLECWKTIPEHFQKDETLLTTYVRELLVLKEHEYAEGLLAKALSHEWHDSWVGLYGLLTVSTPEKTLKTAEGWLKNHGNNPALLLTLGRLCLQNQQWGRAKDFLNESVTLSPTPEAYAELARLQDFLGDHASSHQACRQGLLSAIQHLVPVTEFNKEKKQKIIS